MGTSQSRASEGSSSPAIERLKRYSKADLKTPLKAAFSRHRPSSVQEQGSEGTSSDYETPIYETKRRSVVVSLLLYILLSRWLCLWSRLRLNQLGLIISFLSTATTTTASRHAYHCSMPGMDFPYSLVVFFNGRITLVSHREDPRQRHLRYRKGGHSCTDRKILCMQGHQQEAYGGP